MPMIEKPKAPTYTTLPKKIKVTEDTYLKAIEYLEWNTSLDAENDLDFLAKNLFFIVFRKVNNNKKPFITKYEGFPKKATTYSPTNAVPSALTGLTSLFGMVRGEPRRYNHLSFMT